MKKFHTYCLLLTTCSLFAFAALSAEADTETYSGTIELTETTNLVVASGNTLTWSGLVSGSGGIKLSGGGTLILSHANNTFTGGIENNASIAQANATMAFGTGLLKVTARSNGSFALNAANGVFSNDVSYVANNGQDGYSAICCLAPATIAGSMSGTKTFWLKPGTGSSAKKSLTIEQAVSSDADLGVNSWGDIHFKAPVKCGTFDNSAAVWSQNGTVTFDATNTISVFKINSCNINCVATNAMGTGSALLHAYGCWANVDRCVLDMNGYPQSLGALEFYYGMSKQYWPTNSEYGIHIESKANPSKLTLTGYSENKTTMHVICTGVELELNAANPSFVQEFQYRQHTTTQPLAITSGTLKLTEGSTFNKVPKLTIGANGALVVSNASGFAFSAATNVVINGKLEVANITAFPFKQDKVALELSSSAEIKLPEPKILAVASLKVDGEPYTGAVYELGNLRVLTKVETQTWQGGGSDDHVSTTGNWDVGDKLDLSTGCRKVKFATGGTTATLDTSMNVWSVVLNAENGFTFDKLADETITAVEGLEFTGTSGNKTYTFKPAFIDKGETNEVWTIPANNVIDFAGGFVATNLQNTIYKYDTGKLCLRDGTAISGSLKAEEGELYLSGRIATPGHVDQGIAANNDYTIVTGMRDNYQHGIVKLDNVIIEKPFYPRTLNSLMSVQTVNNTTNVILGHVRGENPSQNYNTAGSAGILRFLGGMTMNCSLSLKGDGVTEIYDYSGRTNSFTSLYAFGSKVVIKGTQNTVSTKIGFDSGIKGTFVFEQDHAFVTPLPMLYFGYWYGNQDVTNTIDLAGTVQQTKVIWQKIRTSDGSFDHKCAIIGGEGSMLEITEGGTNSVWVSGAVSFKMTGKKYLLISHRQSSTTGQLIVDSGTVEFGLGAAWPNASRVEVNGSGKLILGEDSYFGENTDLVFTESGTMLSQGSAKTLKFRSVTAGGTEIPIGTYTYATAPEALKAHLDPNTESTIKVGKKGTTITLW